LQLNDFSWAITAVSNVLFVSLQRLQVTSATAAAAATTKAAASAAAIQMVDDDGLRSSSSRQLRKWSSLNYVFLFSDKWLIYKMFVYMLFV
jgi:hypothetical protein